MTVLSLDMAYRSFRGGSGRLDTRLDTPPISFRHHPDSRIALDIDRSIDFIAPGTHKLMDVIFRLKDGLPYLFRYETGGRNYRLGHPEMEIGSVTIPVGNVTTRSVINEIVAGLSPDWQVTVLPNRIILYKETITYAQQIERIRRGP